MVVLAWCNHEIVKSKTVKTELLDYWFLYLVYRVVFHNFFIFLARTMYLCRFSPYIIFWLCRLGCRIHRLHLCRWVKLPERVSCGPLGWECRIHRLHLCRSVRLPQRVSCDPRLIVSHWSLSDNRSPVVS